jgi:hypothetical protein
MLRSSDPELKNVFDFAMAFAGAIKNYTLYPQDHAIAKKHLLNLSRHIGKFFANYDNLRLDVDKNKLRYGGELVYQGVAEESDVAYLLSRDGVKYLEFVKGIELWEIQSLLKLVNKYRVLDEENDGDIATALWEQEYPHIQYKAIDILSLDAPSINFSGFKVAPAQNISEHDGEGHSGGLAGRESEAEGSSGWNGDDAEPGTGNADEYDQGVSVSEQALADAPPVSLAITAKGNDLWSLSPLERYELEKMVAAAEKQDDTDNIIDILLIILVIQNNQQDFTYTLDFLQDRFLYTFKIHRFDTALKVLNNLGNIKQSFTGKKRWALPLLDNFFATISQPESLREPRRLLLDSKAVPDSQQMEYLWRIFCLFPPRVLFTLGPLVSKVESPKMRQALNTVIIHHTQRAPQILADVVPQLDEELCLRLMPVVRQMEKTVGNVVFTSMALHNSNSVRNRAFGILASRNMLDPIALFPLLNDPDQEIRTKIIALLGEDRNEQREARLLSYLKNEEYTIHDRAHILACYDALGHCGSTASIPFLRHVLMGGNLSNIFSSEGRFLKQGAANALHALKIDEADDILKAGASSMMPDVRLACKKAAGK